MLVDFWAILIFAIICIIILIIIIASGSDNTQKIQSEFSGKDINLMLNSFLRAPYGTWNGMTIAGIIAEDSISNDYTRTFDAFDKYFSGVDVYSDNPVGGYFFGINGGYMHLLDMKNRKFIEQAGTSLAMSNQKGGGLIPVPAGDLYKTLSGLKTGSITYQSAETTIPRIDGQDITVNIVIIYDEKYEKKFS